MEADSTTYENNANSSDDICLPFSSSPEDLEFYKVLISHIGNRSLESQLIEKLQSLGLIPKNIACPENRPDCKVSIKSARVVDRFQLLCEGCGKRLPIRTGTFFFRLQCSILQALQIILAWCEDADINTAAQFFDVKPKVACSIYDRLDDLAIEQVRKHKLGGENVVVMSEMYPDCLNRLSPDTTDQAHVHQILMVADTKRIPTNYKLYVIQRDPKRLRSNTDSDQIIQKTDEYYQTLYTAFVDYEKAFDSVNTWAALNSLQRCHIDWRYIKCLKEEVKASLLSIAKPGSFLVTGNNVPLIDRMVPLPQLIQHCNVNMRHFLSSRIWRQALTLCSAARELCSGAAGACAAPLQRYLDTAAYRLRHPRHFYDHTLRALAADVAHPVLRGCS